MGAKTVFNGNRRGQDLVFTFENHHAAGIYWFASFLHSHIYILHMLQCAGACVCCVCACARACVNACMCVCKRVRACMRVCVCMHRHACVCT